MMRANDARGVTKRTVIKNSNDEIRGNFRIIIEIPIGSRKV